jgi:hypothetical protein
MFCSRWQPGCSTFRIAPAACLLAILGFFATAGAERVCAQASDSTATQVPIVISDFELFSAATKPNPSATQKPGQKKASNPQASPTAANGSNAAPPPPVVYGDEDAPTVQARRLMDFFSMTLLQTLQQGGFTATRQQGQNPSNGALIRGVFTEPDAKNRIRRALLGSDTPGGRFLLYVGLFNLNKPDQPLYEPAPVQSADARYGPVITLNTYIPLAKYELDKDPTEEDVRKICVQIARSLKELLDANPSAFNP